VNDIKNCLVCPPESFDRFADFRRTGKQDHASPGKDSGSAEADLNSSFAPLYGARQ
jgi:hypothetical protein